ncbi:unnamed protein product, partial [Rotaria sordida]
GQISTTTPTLEPLENNLTATNLLLLKQTTIEEELLKRQQQIDELRIQVEKLKQLEPENLMELKQNNQKLRLEQQKYLHQHLREIEDEQIWLSENRHLFQTHSDLIFNNKQQTLMNIKLLEQHLNNECIRISQDYPSRANEFQQQHLYQYYYDSSDAEAWLGEQELYMMSEEHGKDELTTQASIHNLNQSNLSDNIIYEHNAFRTEESQTRRKHLRSLASLHYGKALKLFSPDDNPLESLRLLIEEVALAEFGLQNATDSADYQTRMNTIASQISSLNCNVTILQEAQENIIPSLKEKLGDNYLYQFAPNNPISASVANGLLTLIKKDKITFFDIILNSNILDEIV